MRSHLRQSHDFDCDSEESESHSQDFYFIELGVWSSHLVVSDKLVGKAFLKFSSSEDAGSISSWVKLKDEEQRDAGELYVSISKELISVDRNVQAQLSQFKRQNLSIDTGKHNESAAKSYHKHELKNNESQQDNDYLHLV